MSGVVKRGGAARSDTVPREGHSEAPDLEGGKRGEEQGDRQAAEPSELVDRYLALVREVPQDQGLVGGRRDGRRLPVRPPLRAGGRPVRRPLVTGGPHGRAVSGGTGLPTRPRERGDPIRGVGPARWAAEDRRELVEHVVGLCDNVCDPFPQKCVRPRAGIRKYAAGQRVQLAPLIERQARRSECAARDRRLDDDRPGAEAADDAVPPWEEGGEGPEIERVFAHDGPGGGDP